MSLDIGDAISNGFERLTDRNGLLLLGVFVAFGLVNTVVGQSFFTAYLEFVRSSFETMPGGPGMGDQPFPFAPGGQSMPFSLPLSLPVVAALSLGLAVLSEALRIVTIRVIASDERTTIPDTATRNIGMATVTAFLLGLVVNIAIGIGLVFLILPGVFLAVSFYFVRPAIALEDKGIDALSRSWELATGNRLDLFLLLVLVWFISLLASIPATILNFVSPIAGALVGVVVNAVVLVFGIAVATDAFLQLRTDEDDDEDIGAVDADSEFFDAEREEL
ncbi:hypothetical protein [Haloarcula montana]|uniref:hypothetical protein n=1 Tax=Haloarcula montana TaxID=3111776 RepID=UPI002D767712|nr:hypothetical protein [Haloarcula sp. GH36]